MSKKRIYIYIYIYIYIGRQCLCLSRLYKHLGSTLSCDYSCAPELTQRANDMWGAMRPLHGRFFRLQRVPIKTKAHVASAVVMARGFYNAGTWPLLRANESRRLFSATARAQTAIFDDGYSKTHCERPPYRWVVSQDEVLAPDAMISLQRLSLLTRIATSDPGLLCDAIIVAQGAPRSWLKAVRHDLERFARTEKYFEKFTALADDELFTAVHASTGLFRKQLQSASWSRAYNIGLVEHATPCGTALVGAFRCHQCNADFSSQQALKVHQFKSHGVKTAIRAFVGSVQCPACLGHFHTRPRLCTHLQAGSARCKAFVMATQTRLSNDELAALDSADALANRQLAKSGRLRTHAEQATTCSNGPLPLLAARLHIAHGLKNKSRKALFNEAALRKILADLDLPSNGLDADAVIRACNF